MMPHLSYTQLVSAPTGVDAKNDMLELLVVMHCTYMLLNYHEVHVGKILVEFFFSFLFCKFIDRATDEVHINLQKKLENSTNISSTVQTSYSTCTCSSIKVFKKYINVLCNVVSWMDSSRQHGVKYMHLE